MSRIVPVVLLTLRAHEPTDKVLGQLNVVQRIALGHNLWHLTMGILSMPMGESLHCARTARYTARCTTRALRATFRLCSPRRAPKQTPWNRP